VAIAVNSYIDRVLMGCVLSYAIDPERYTSGASGGFVKILRERSYAAAIYRWQTGLREKLMSEATRHLRRVLLDWRNNLLDFQRTDCSEAEGGCWLPKNGNECPRMKDPTAKCARQDVREQGYLIPGEDPRPPHGFVPLPDGTPFAAYVLRQLLVLDGHETVPQFDLVGRAFSVLDRYIELKFRFWPYLVRTVRDITSPPSPPTLGSDATDWLLLRASASESPLNRDNPPSGCAPTRTSEASFAVIEDGGRFLLQWNRRWQKMNHIGGHLKTNESPVSCLARELKEELFNATGDLNVADILAFVKGSRGDNRAADYLESAEGPTDLQFTNYSTSRREWTLYTFHIWHMSLTEQGRETVTHTDPFYSPLGTESLERQPEYVTEWVTRKDISSGFTPMGRPVSPTVKKVLGSDVVEQ
jgi:hypothetical protein